MVWKAIAASATGTSHTRNQLPCQDYGNFVVVENIIIGAVSDGAGSAKYSDIGSKLAVESALNSLKKWIEIHKKNGKNTQEPITVSMAKRVFTNAFNQVITKLEEQVKHNEDYSLKDFSCTLLLFIATRNWIAAMQIGDGFIVARSESSDYQLLFKPTKGEYANETTFVTSKYAMEDMQVKVLSDGDYHFICASTDGLERLAIDTRTWLPSSSFFEPFEKGLEQKKHQEEEKNVQEWLKSAEVNDRTDDDKTMLVCVYENTITSTDSTEAEDAKSEEKSLTFVSKPSKIEKQEIQQLIFNILAGAFWNSQFHNLWLNTSFSRLNTLSIFFMIFIATLIFNSIELYGKAVTLNFNQNQRFKNLLLTITFTLLQMLIGAVLYWLFWHWLVTNK